MANIFSLFRTSKLHIPEDVCSLSYGEELDYWGIDDIYIESCCQGRYHQRKEQIVDEKRREEAALGDGEDEFAGVTCCVARRKKMWDLLEKPNSSFSAKILGTRLSDKMHVMQKFEARNRKPLDRIIENPKYRAQLLSS